ncbi:hypothetical protein [Streptomyces echinatus]|uniref:hypothetical protein n=1 Tax=Streptomyces echinatus TaxID=67293 RepID=UPI0037AA6770
MTRAVGPGWEVLLMPPHVARLAMRAFARSTASASAIGWMFQHAGQRGIFLPAESHDPAWPQGTTYLMAGENVTLPPPSWRVTEREDASGWVRLEGPLLSQPLLVHPIVTLIAADNSCGPSES